MVASGILASSFFILKLLHQRYIIKIEPRSTTKRKRPLASSSSSCGGYAALIGNTPMVELKSLSEATGCRIYAKAEFLNPGGTSKDRIALRMIEEAEASGRWRAGGIVVEGTSGSTGIALAALCRARGYRCLIVMPDDQAKEKVDLLQRFGAEVEVVKPAGIANPKHYYNLAKTRAQELEGAVFMDQFETSANFNAHYYTTGPEIWSQLEDLGLFPDAFVMSAGTGGSIAGVSCYLKQQKKKLATNGSKEVMVCLVDPPGSSLYNKVKHGVCYAHQQSERGIRRHRYDTIAEGIGLDRLTANFARALIDEAYRITDQEAIDMAHYILQAEGLFVGSSTAMNLVGAVLAARQLGPGHTIVTILCDSGQRHLTRFWNREFIEGVNGTDRTGEGEGGGKGTGLRWPTSPPTTLDFIQSREEEERD